jgi:hypothetical protein
MAILVPPLAVSPPLHGRDTVGAEWPGSGRFQQDQVTVATCLPNIGTARHLAEDMNRRSG